MIKKMLKEIRNYLFANEEGFSLEHRMLLSTLVIGIFMGLTGSISNLLLTNSLIASLVPLVLAITASVLYYFARSEKTYRPIAVITAIFGILGVSIVWIYNGGINGPNFMVAITFLILALIIVSNKAKYYIITIFISVNTFILLIQLYRPDTIVNYPTELSRWIDNLIGMYLSAIFVFLIIRFIHKHYTDEKQRAQESDLLKSAFLANMSHEIRTPMNGILGFTQLLLKPDLTSEQKKTYINIVNQSGQRMLNTVNDIVEISKIEAGMVILNLEEVNVQERLDELIQFFTPEAIKKGLKLTLVKEAPKTAQVVTTDQQKLDSIFTNLIKNAIKYTAKGSIEIGYDVTTLEQTPSLQFYVKDSGIGISEERQDAIFERFIQADIVDKDARQGSGLGLAISKAYVEMLGGKIWGISEVDKGSTFFFTLPRNMDSKRKVEISPNVLYENEGNSIIPEISDLKVLIVEDDETSEMLISIELEKFSKEILKVTTGLDALEVCRKHPDIDLVLMDIQMPGMNGYETTRKIRDFNKEVIIIAQTAFALTGDREKAIEAGCNDYIPKPIIKEMLLELIKHFFK